MSAPAPLYFMNSFSSIRPTRVAMGRPVRKLKVSVPQGMLTPPITAPTISKRAHNSVHHCSDEDHTTTEPPSKRRCIANSTSTTSKKASIDNLDCDNVPDVPETDLLALEQVWRQAKKTPSPSLVSSHIFLSHRHIWLTITLSRLLLLRR